MSWRVDVKKSKLARRYQKAIKNQLGFDADIDAYGDIEFQSPKGVTFYVVLYENEWEYFHLLAEEIGGSRVYGEDIEVLFNYMNEVNAGIKAAKIYAEDCPEADGCGFGKLHVRASISGFVASNGEAPSIELIESTIARQYETLEAAVQRYVGLEHRYHDEEEEGDDD